jgi:DNA repair exonuclease SbcCD ATPase subunit
MNLEERVSKIETKMDNFLEAFIGDLKTPGFIQDIREIAIQQSNVADKLDKTVTTLDNIAEKQNEMFGHIVQHSEQIATMKKEQEDLKNKVEEIDLEDIKGKWGILSKVVPVIVYIIIGFVAFWILSLFGIKLDIADIIRTILMK